MASMMELLRQIVPLRMAPASDGTDQQIEILRTELPFVVHEYPTGSEFNGWVAPHKWEVRKAEIRKDGRLVYDGMAHPLGVIGYGRSFQGRVSLEDLKPHLFTHPKWADGLVYHCDLYYKVGQENWGFCVPRRLFDALEPGDYDVDLQTSHEQSVMKVCDYFIPGASPQTIVFNAHNCHAAQANDDLAGVVVGMEVMKRLSQRQNYHSFRLIVAPEHFGTVFYLAGLPRAELGAFKCCMFIEMVGNENRLALQETFTGKTELDRAAYQYLRHYRPDFHSAPFRKVVGNDETVWEAPGYEVPTISLSRWPYAEYHSSYDNMDIISERMLDDSVGAILGIVDVLETSYVMKRKFDGLIALSNPKYNLYIAQADPSIRPTISADQQKWNYLMDCLPRYFDGKMTVLDIAERHELPHDKLVTYLRGFVEKGLIDLVMPS